VYTRGWGGDGKEEIGAFEGEWAGDENATSGRGGGVDGPGDGAREDVEDAGEENERTSETGLSLKRAC
jgi:hypothetical protein